MVVVVVLVYLGLFGLVLGLGKGYEVKAVGKVIELDCQCFCVTQQTKMGP